MENMTVSDALRVQRLPMLWRLFLPVSRRSQLLTHSAKDQLHETG